MGGIQIMPNFTDIEWDEDDQQTSSTTSEEQQPEYRLTADGVYQLLCMGHWLPITVESIPDKSKANVSQKALVLVQVGWFGLQCIVRKAYGLPLSLLEVHTVVHVVTAATMYGFWWMKPLDIGEPEVLDDTTRGALEFNTHIWLLSPSMRSRLDSVFINNEGGPISEDKRNAPGIKILNWSASPTLPNGSNNSHNFNMTFEAAKVMTKLDRHHLNYIVDYITQHHTEWIGSQHQNQSIKTIIKELRGDNFNSAPLNLGSHNNLMATEEDSNGKLQRRKKESRVVDYLNRLIILLSTFGGNEGRPFQNYNLLLTVLLPAIYGGVHLAVWRAAYPTVVEHIMWRTACIVIMTGLPVLLVLCAVFYLVMVIPSILERRQPDERRHGLDIYFPMAIVVVCIAAAAMLLLISARCFVIVESFISLRSAPIGVYWTPAWIQMLPHV
ncbi:hypothetical protein PFICI_10301 [Pestalotiopsis fici W106-1]|uniref:Uncharacterized protein n=1 Tax=Pestalotiopsis fici (strain W106-1 / CGMCC3.15140) TaxID=1229662 RepID=W3WWT4_PESFW|nr:uncharacterized protein PFICI_10301 [Pestalotiopsis fici W106-1]ETS78239.1 hypothetical protein PFICI_10301 [Pestalotiopsis fici W106-1]